MPYAAPVIQRLEKKPAVNPHPFPHEVCFAELTFLIVRDIPSRHEETNYRIAAALERQDKRKVRGVTMATQAARRQSDAKQAERREAGRTSAGSSMNAERLASQHYARRYRERLRAARAALGNPVRPWERQTSPCACGAPAYSRGMCHPCYSAWYYRRTRVNLTQQQN